MNRVLKYYLVIFIFIVSAKMNVAQQVTWARDIACITYTHCSGCHNNQNSLVAFPLASYSEVYAERNAMRYYTGYRFMPPYQPSTNHSRYIGEKSLTQHEIDLIASWVDSGCPRGDSTTEPLAPVILPVKPTITNPDLTLNIPLYQIPNLHVNFRRCFVASIPLGEHFIKTIEVIPGNLSAIYAVYVYADTSITPVLKDAADSDPGYYNFGGTGSDYAKPIYGWVHHASPLTYPEHVALKMDSGSRIIIQVEYAEDAGGKMDSTRVSIKFANDSEMRVAEVSALLNEKDDLTNGPFIIPPDSDLVFHEERIIPSGLTILGISPMLHHLCTDFYVYAIKPNADTVYLIQEEMHGEIWSEGTYFFKRPVYLPAGSKLRGVAHYNNSLENGNNPNNPPVAIHEGFSEYDEEMLFHFQCIPYQIGDELMIWDSANHMEHYLQCTLPDSVTGIQDPVNLNNGLVVYPNPSHTTISVQLLNNPQTIQKIWLMNLLGETIQELKSMNGFSSEFDISSVAQGMYILKINTKYNNYTSKLIKQ